MAVTEILLTVNQRTLNDTLKLSLGLAVWNEFLRTFEKQNIAAISKGGL